MPKAGYWARLKKENPILYWTKKRNYYRKYIAKMKLERPEKYKQVILRQNQSRKKR